MYKDTETLKAISNGNKEALATLYDSFAPAIYGLALRITESKDRAAMVVQETFVKIWKSANSFDPSTKDPFSWVIEVAKEVAFAHESISDQFDFFAFQKSNSIGYNLEQLFSQIDKKHRQVLELAFFRRLTEEEIEEKMNIPVGTVATRLRLAIKAMREKLS